MDPFPPTGIGLKRAFSLHDRSFELTELPILANAFKRCQFERRCATVGILLGHPETPLTPCLFGFSPKISTPVEKTVENHKISDPELGRRDRVCLARDPERCGFYTAKFDRKPSVNQ